MRGAHQRHVSALRLLAAFDHTTSTVIAQQRVAGKSNEIPALTELLKPLDVAEAVVTVDTMQPQTSADRWITRRGDLYLLVVKVN